MSARWMQDVPVEEWRPVPGFPDYQVSSLGRISSTLPWRGDAGPRILKGRSNGRGYRVIAFSRDGDKIPRYVHHVVAEVFHGPRPEWCEEIRHLDGDSLNNAASNLRYGTRSENQLDSVRHGTNHWSKRTHCKRNHAFDEENTYRRENGRRMCRACVRIRNAKRTAVSA